MAGKSPLAFICYSFLEIFVTLKKANSLASK